MHLYVLFQTEGPMEYWLHQMGNPPKIKNLHIYLLTVCTKVDDKRNDFDFDMVNSLMAMYVGVPRVACIYLSLFVSLEHLIQATSTAVTKP